MTDFLSELFGKKKTTNEKGGSQKDPWGPAIPYLTGALQSGQDIFNQYGTLSPDEQAASGDQASVLQTRQSSPAYQLAGQDATSILGAGGPQYNVMHSVAAPSVGYDMGTANPARARATQGALDPTQALMQQLSGQSNNPYLHSMADAATQQQRQTYQDQADDANQNLAQSVLPAIRSGGVMSGQYGGTRQGLAEGTAIGHAMKANDRNARDLAQSSGGYYANLAGNDYEAAQQRQAQAAGDLNQQAQSAKQFDASNAFNARGQNANFDLRAQEDTLGQNNTNNNLALQTAVAQPGIDQAGLNLFNSATGATDNNYDQLMNVLGLPRQVAQGAYSNYVNPLTNIAGLGGSSTFSNHGTEFNRDSAFNIGKMIAAMMAG